MVDTFTLAIHYRNGHKDYSRKFDILDAARAAGTYQLHFDRSNGGIRRVTVNQGGIVVAVLSKKGG